MRRYLPSFLAAAALGAAALTGGCATPPGSTHSVVSAAAAGADLNQAAKVVDLARSIYVTSGGTNAVVIADAAKASAALTAAGQSLQASTATSADVSQDIQLASASIRAALDGLGAVSPSAQARVQGYVDAFDAALILYNAEAPSAGLPTVPLATL